MPGNQLEVCAFLVVVFLVFFSEIELFEVSKKFVDSFLYNNFF